MPTFTNKCIFRAKNSQRITKTVVYLSEKNLVWIICRYFIHKSDECPGSVLLKTYKDYELREISLALLEESFQKLVCWVEFAKQNREMFSVLPGYANLDNQ